MRLEQIPVLIGIIVAILGLGLVLDAQLPEGVVPSRERRRRERAQRHRGGETLVGLGIMAVAAALIGRDTWRFGTVAILLGTVLLVAGGWFNREYLREIFAFRGVSRRGEKRSSPRDRSELGRRGTPRDVADIGPVGSAPVVPGLADAPPPRDRSKLRGDREAPIMTAAEGVAQRSKPANEDTPPDGHPRLRIR